MAVVKSPKNNKRKTLWINTFKNNNKTKIASINKIKKYSAKILRKSKTKIKTQNKTNSFSSLWHRKRDEITVRNSLPFLTSF